MPPRTSPGTPARSVRSDRPSPGRHRLAHRAVGLGQVDRRRRRRAPAGRRRAARLRARRRQLRHGLNADLGFTAADRAENVRRVGEVARLMADAGVVALVPLISPYRADRDRARAAARRRPACRSSRCSSTRRSSCASSATPRASTPRPGPARSPASPASTTPTRRPLAPELVLVPEDGDPLEQAAKVAALLH